MRKKKTTFSGASPDQKNPPPIYPMKIEILVSVESSYFSYYSSEFLGPNYDSFRCYEQKRS